MLNFKFLILTVLFTVFIGENPKNANPNISIEINYFRGDLKEALLMAKKTNKLIFVDFYAEWCSPCKMMDKQTFTNEGVIAKLNSDYITIKVDGDNPSESFKEMVNLLDGYPTMLLLNYKGEKLDELIGYADPEELLHFISFENIEKKLELKKNLKEDRAKVMNLFKNTFNHLDPILLKDETGSNVKNIVSILKQCNDEVDKLVDDLEEYSHVFEFQADIMSEIENKYPTRVQLIKIIFALKDNGLLQ